MLLLKKWLLELWQMVLQASFVALIMIFFHVPEKINSYIEHSKNIEKARELLNMIKSQNNKNIQIQEIKGGKVV